MRSYRGLTLRVLASFAASLVLATGSLVAGGSVPSANAAPGTAAIAISAGDYHACLLTAAGGVKCWGYNTHGQLGDGTTTDSLVPVDVTGLASGVAAISAGFYHTCALTTGGGVKCWGLNETGQLGNGTTTDSLIPTDVVGLGSGVAQVAAGTSHSCAVMTTGAAKCWGRNAYGALGNGTYASSNIPVDVLGLGNAVAAISAGLEYTCAATTGGAAKCWGHNNSGELGNGTHSGSDVAVDVSGLSSGVASIAAGEGEYSAFGPHTCALTTAGGAKCWGDNEEGQLGDGTTTSSRVPVDVSGLSSGVAAVAVGTIHTCAVTTSGGAKCWGRNYSGALGDGTTVNSSVPVDVSGLASGVVAVSAGVQFSCALTSLGWVKCWGYNSWGQLGNGTTTDSAVPVDVSGAPVTGETLTITSNTTLTEDHNGNIVIQADNVTLDCAGHTVTGTSAGLSTSGIFVGFQSGVTIKNCIVAGDFTPAGIEVADSQGVTVAHNSSLHNTGNGYFVVRSSETTLSANNAIGNGAQGVHVDTSTRTRINHSTFRKNVSYGIALSDSSDAAINYNISSRNDRDGVALINSTGVVLNANQIMANVGGGVNLFGSSGNSLISNVASHNGSHGLDLVNSSQNTLRGNSSVGNAGEGFLVEEGSNGNLLQCNKAKANLGNGFDLSTGSQNTLRGNLSVGNGTGGVENANEGFLVENGSNGNSLKWNVARTNLGNGFMIVGSNDNTLSMNRSEGNLRGYFLVNTKGLVFSGNAASGSAGLGIEMYQSSGGTFRGNSSTRNWGGFIIGDASNGNTFDKNMASGNQNAGFSLEGASQNLLTSNQASNNGGFGFSLTGATQNTLRGNISQQNADEGFMVQEESNGNRLVGNISMLNAIHGFMIVHSHDNQLIGNTSQRNSGSGFLVSEASANALRGNSGLHNGFAGFHLEGSANNVLSGNTAMNNAAGFALFGSTGNRLVGNSANHNVGGSNGFLIDSSNGNTLARNVANANDPVGFMVQNGSSDNVFNQNIGHANSWVDAAYDGTGTGNVWTNNNFGTTDGI